MPDGSHRESFQWIMRYLLRRGLGGWRFIAVVGISIGLVGLQFWTTHFASYVIPEHEPTFLSDVMLFSQYGSSSELYLFVLPLLASWLGGGTIASELRCRRFTPIAVRSGRHVTVGASACAGFVLGMIGGIFPLALNLCVAAAANPRLVFIDGTEFTSDNVALQKYVLVSSRSWLYPLYERNQILFIIAVVGIVCGLSGLFALLSVAISLIVSNGYLEIFVPFVVNLVWWMAPTLTDGLIPDEWSPLIFLFVSIPSATGHEAHNALGCALTLALLAITATALFRTGRAHDID